MKNYVVTAVRQSFALTLIAGATFLLLEPALSLGVTATSQFTISQSVTSELSFSTPPSNVTMSPSLGGITGGTANGVTQVVVTTNSPTGYTMTLQASSSLGMQANASTTAYIPAYGYPGSTTPEYTFTTPSNSARFGYTVNATTSSDVVQLFRNNSTTCNQSGGSPDGAHCWLNASTTAVQIINRSTATPASGSTTTLNFRVVINPNPSPALPNDTYVATTTLTATAS